MEAEYDVWLDAFGCGLKAKTDSGLWPGAKTVSQLQSDHCCCLLLQPSQTVSLGCVARHGGQKVWQDPTSGSHHPFRCDFSGDVLNLDGWTDLLRERKH